MAELCLILVHNMFVKTSFCTYTMINGCYSLMEMITLYVLAFMGPCCIFFRIFNLLTVFSSIVFPDSWNKTMKSSGRGQEVFGY